MKEMNTKDKYGRTPLHYAALHKDIEKVHALLNAGADVHSRDAHWKTPFYLACGFGGPVLIRLLLDAGSDVHAGDVYGLSPLHHAAWHNRNPEVLKILLDTGAHVDARDLRGSAVGHPGRTPLDIAKDTGNFSAVEILLEAELRTRSNV